MTSQEIIDGALDILSTPDRFGSNWLLDAGGDAVHDRGEPEVGLGRRTCLDGALNLAAQGLTPETATTEQAVNGPRDHVPALLEAKERVRAADARPGAAGLLSINAGGYEYVLDVLRRAC